MSNLTKIKDSLTKQEVRQNLANALGLNYKNTKDREKIIGYANSVYDAVKRSHLAAQQDEKKIKQDLSTCSVHSICDAMIDAARHGLHIDSRQHAYLIKYGNIAQFQIGYRAYLHKVKERYPDANFSVDIVFKEDELTLKDINGNSEYTLVKANPFNSNYKDLVGVLVCVNYTNESGDKVTKAIPVPKERIDRAKGAAKQDYVWASDYGEKAKAAAIKNAFKTLFSSIAGLNEIIEKDNENYEPENYIDKNTLKEKQQAIMLCDNLNDLERVYTDFNAEHGGHVYVDDLYDNCKGQLLNGRLPGFEYMSIGLALDGYELIKKEIEETKNISLWLDKNRRRVDALSKINADKYKEDGLLPKDIVENLISEKVQNENASDL